MAISQVHPLLLLLVSLFFIPALRAISFEYCNKDGYDLGNVTRVEISPNPVVLDENLKFTVYGTANATGGDFCYGVAQVSVKFRDSYFIKRLYNMDCIAAGMDFVITLPNYYLYSRSKGYKHAILFFERNGKKRMCVEFDLPLSAPKFVSA